MKKLISVIITAFILSSLYTMATAKEVNESVVRLHILANSNDQQDQAVKLEVRDKMGDLSELSLSGITLAELAYGQLEKMLPEIEDIANKTLSENGFAYTASATIGVEHFPPRQYGEVTLPSGYYKSLIVTLGEGEGDNWWCVMYPPLCYAGETVEGTEELSRAIEGEVTYKFKVLEIIEEIKCSNLFTQDPTA